MAKFSAASLVLCLYIVYVLGAEKDEFMRAHNSARAQLGLPSMQWSTTLYSYALTYAKMQVNNCINGRLVHSGGPYGENLFWGSGMDWSPTDAVQAWVSEKKYYNYNNTNTCAYGQQCGHYTQVVWRNSVNLGCAKFRCDNRPTVYIICSYGPPGNYIGQKPY